MSVPVMLPPDREAERLEELEAAFLRSPSSTWPLASPATAVTVELPVRGTPDEPGGPDAWVSQYRTHGLCCKY